MKTTHQKFHPDATPPEGAVYIGSIESAWKHDLYLKGDHVYRFSDRHLWAEESVETVESLSVKSENKWYIMAATLILRAYREKQSMPTPMTREEVLEAVTAARFVNDYPGLQWCNENERDKRAHREEVEYILIAANHPLFPRPSAK